jgi:hypothetical protein
MGIAAPHGGKYIFGKTEEAIVSESIAHNKGRK